MTVTAKMLAVVHDVLTTILVLDYGCRKFPTYINRLTPSADFCQKLWLQMLVTADHDIVATLIVCTPMQDATPLKFV